MNDPYLEFLSTKTRRHAAVGIEVAPDDLPLRLFPYQRAVTSWALGIGRGAIYGDCGLGKTAMQLVWAERVASSTDRPTLVLAPLAVTGQTVTEGDKFGIEVVAVKDMDEVRARRSRVYVANYERLSGLDPGYFGAVVLDEAGILKSFMGATKTRIVDAFRDTPYRLSCSATPAPNDHMELGNQAEHLGVLTSHEMLARWFISDQSAMGTYRLKGHARTPFWDWVASWARCFGKPSDLGDQFSDEGYVLPPLVVRNHVVGVDVVAGRGDKLFRDPELSATSIHAERRITLEARVERVRQLVHDERDEPWILWCETDYEADALCAAIPDAVEVRGGMSIEMKEQRLLGFSSGAIRVLVTKPRIAGFGLNWQHCARAAFVAPLYSFEAYYQAVRRNWRFGQDRSVEVHMVMGSTEIETLTVLERKRNEHAEMAREMYAAARRAQAGAAPTVSYRPTFTGTVPQWLRSF